MSKVLLVGANGFVGRVVSIELEKEHQLTKASHTPGEGIIQLDATDYDQTLKVIGKYEPEVIVNCAGIVENSERAEANVTITMNLLKAATASKLELKRFIVSSSAAVYGNVESLPVDEDTSTGPTGPYGMYKAQESERAKAYGLEHGINVVTARIFNPLGPGMHERFLVSALLRQIGEVKASERESVEVHRLDSLRDYIDVRDIARAISSLVSAKKLVHTSYNIGSGVATSNEELVQTLLRAVSMSNVQIVQSSGEPEKLVASQADITRIYEELGWQPQYDLESTITEIINNV